MGLNLFTAVLIAAAYILLFYLFLKNRKKLLFFAFRKHQPLEIILVGSWRSRVTHVIIVVLIFQILSLFTVKLFLGLLLTFVLVYLTFIKFVLVTPEELVILNFSKLVKIRQDEIRLIELRSSYDKWYEFLKDNDYEALEVRFYDVSGKRMFDFSPSEITKESRDHLKNLVERLSRSGQTKLRVMFDIKETDLRDFNSIDRDFYEKFQIFKKNASASREI